MQMSFAVAGVSTSQHSINYCRFALYLCPIACCPYCTPHSSCCCRQYLVGFIASTLSVHFLYFPCILLLPIFPHYLDFFAKIEVQNFSIAGKVFARFKIAVAIQWKYYNILTCLLSLSLSLSSSFPISLLLSSSQSNLSRRRSATNSWKMATNAQMNIIINQKWHWPNQAVGEKSAEKHRDSHRRML